MKNKKYIAVFLLSFFTLMFSLFCKKDSPINNPPNTVTDPPTPYSIIAPPYFPQPVIPAFNPLTVEGVRLGRMLYYDPVLSSNGLSCSSCHQQKNAFSVPLFTTKTGQKISVPPHINLAWNPDFNWEGSVHQLDTLCLDDFGPDFFNTNKDTLFSRLSTHAIYPSLFKKVYGITNINSLKYSELQLKITYAISQFMRTLISSNSNYDKYPHNYHFTASEFNGLKIFYSEKGDCFHCHGGPLLTDNLFHNNGLDSIFSPENFGKYSATFDMNDIGKFSSPTLRNAEFTSPYMHDGRFKTLEEVVEFYNSGTKKSATLDPIMTKPGKEHGLNLTAQEKTDLVNFLKTFSDTSFINNKNFGTPF